MWPPGAGSVLELGEITGRIVRFREGKWEEVGGYSMVQVTAHILKPALGLTDRMLIIAGHELNSPFPLFLEELLIDGISVHCIDSGEDLVLLFALTRCFLR